jgi:hypothetical protein
MASLIFVHVFGPQAHIVNASSCATCPQQTFTGSTCAVPQDVCNVAPCTFVLSLHLQNPLGTPCVTDGHSLAIPNHRRHSHAVPVVTTLDMHVYIYDASASFQLGAAFALLPRMRRIELLPITRNPSDFFCVLLMATTLFVRCVMAVTFVILEITCCS